MFNEYIDKAMQHAHYEQIEDGTYFGQIPGFKGVWANKLLISKRSSLILHLFH